MKILVCSSDLRDLEDPINQSTQLDGIINNHYFIPTRELGKGRLQLDAIRTSFDEFIVFACGHPEFNFLIAPIGCRENEYDASQIAPMFANLPSNCLLPYEFSRIFDTQSRHPARLTVRDSSYAEGKKQLKQMFGHYHSTVEDLIRQHLLFICPESQPFDLQVMKISNGGLFLRIRLEQLFHLRHPHSATEIKYTSESVSLIANHFVFNSLQNQLRAPWIIEICDALDSYIQSSHQAEQIFLALR